MANTLKIKVGIGAVGLFLLILIPLLENKFFSPVTVKRWGQLAWDDFQGIPQPFSTYEAGISSSIYLEYDSVKKRYVAYAGQNNIASWARRSQDEQGYLLNHEQYHFNITELHARMLNNYIEENPDGSLKLFLLRLGSLNIDLRRMQRKYDRETDHSLVYDKQRHWEFRIDSLLMLQKGWLTDHFSGAQVYLPHPSDSSKGLIDGLPYRYYEQYSYGMRLSLTSYQASDINYRSVVTNVKRNIEKRTERLKMFSLDTANTFRVFAISEDSSDYTHYQLWIANDNYLYQVKARYPNNTGDTTGYARIASSFINSLHVVNTDSYWIAKFEATESPIVRSTLTEWKKNEKGNNDKYCIRVGPSERHGFFRGPFYRDDQAILVAYDDVVHGDSLHYDDVLLVNKDWYTYKPSAEGQIYFVPADKIPDETFNMKFGYILLQDSAKQCYHFYHHNLEVKPNHEPVKTEL